MIVLSRYENGHPILVHPDNVGLVERMAQRNPEDFSTREGSMIYLMSGGRVAVRETMVKISGLMLEATSVPRETAQVIGWRTDDYLMETADKELARNWQSNHRILPIFAGDAQTKLAGGSHGGQ